MKYIEIDFQYLMKIYYEFVNGIKKDDEAIAEEISKMIAEQAYEDIKQAYAQIINNWYAFRIWSKGNRKAFKRK